jgi:hypothetical protein
VAHGGERGPGRARWRRACSRGDVAICSLPAARRPRAAAAAAARRRLSAHSPAKAASLRSAPCGHWPRPHCFNSNCLTGRGRCGRASASSAAAAGGSLGGAGAPPRCARRAQRTRAPARAVRRRRAARAAVPARHPGARGGRSGRARRGVRRALVRVRGTSSEAAAGGLRGGRGSGLAVARGGPGPALCAAIGGRTLRRRLPRKSSSRPLGLYLLNALASHARTCRRATEGTLL